LRVTLKGSHGQDPVRVSPLDFIPGLTGAWPGTIPLSRRL